MDELNECGLRSIVLVLALALALVLCQCRLPTSEDEQGVLRGCSKDKG